jgi:hypothetical protein
LRRRHKAFARGNVRLQPGLVVFDEEEIIALLCDDRRANVTLAEHGVTDDDPALDRHDAQQFESGLVFIGLGIDFDLDKDRFDERGVGGDEMLAGHRAGAAATQRLTVEGERFFPLVATCSRCHLGCSRLDPTRQGSLKGHRVQATEQFRQARGGRGLATGKAEQVGQP